MNRRHDLGVYRSVASHEVDPVSPQYLARWRIQVAANLLVQSGAKVSTIGSEVGYDSEAAFSRAFKKETGVAPGAWRAGRRRIRSRITPPRQRAT